MSGSELTGAGADGPEAGPALQPSGEDRQRRGVAYTRRIEGPPHSAAPKYPIESVDKALRVLLLFRDRRSIRLSEVATQLGVAKSTAHRLLAMLLYHGFVEQDDDTQVYMPGAVFREIGLSSVQRLGIRQAARAQLERLVVELGESAHLVVLDGTSVVFLDSIESPHALRIGSRVGVRMPAHCTAAGKVLLAELPPGALQEIYPDGTPDRLTDRSLGSLKELERELESVRSAGYATNFGESEDGLCAVAVAIPHAKPPAAITVSAPSQRLTAADAPPVAAAIAAAAAAVSA